MNHDILIKITHHIAVYTVIASTYWIFTFLMVVVFDLEIFRLQIGEVFFLTLFGIFVILISIMILNIMSNLSKISAAITTSVITEPHSKKHAWRYFFLASLTFPVLAVVLFAMDNLFAQQKKNFLIASAEHFISENKSTLVSLAHYKFSPEYVKSAERILNILNRIDKNFPEVMVIFPDVVDGKHLFLGFGGRQYDDKHEPEKQKYIYSTSNNEREYLSKVFAKNEMVSRFFYAGKRNYQLYFPVVIDGEKLVLYFSDFRRYADFSNFS